MRRSVRLASRPGLWWGLQERSSMGWPARYRPTHRLTVAGETWKRSAARRTGQPSSTTRWARRRRPSGVSGALAWVMKASGQRCECVNPHPAGGLHTTSAPFTTSQGSTAIGTHTPLRSDSRSTTTSTSTSPQHHDTSPSTPNLIYTIPKDLAALRISSLPLSKID